MSTHDTGHTALATIASIPRNDEGPVFREPWEAQAFAMAVKLNEQGIFTWTEWAEQLSREIEQAGADDDPTNYYMHWMSALEKLVASHGLVSADEARRPKGRLGPGGTSNPPWRTDRAWPRSASGRKTDNPHLFTMTCCANYAAWAGPAPPPHSQRNLRPRFRNYDPSKRSRPWRIRRPDAHLRRRVRQSRSLRRPGCKS